MMKVYLDDIRDTPTGWTRAYNAWEAIDLLRTGQVKEISLDHDLGDEPTSAGYGENRNPGTGYNVCLWMVENNVFPATIYIHSKNPVGKQNMFQLLNRYAPKNVKIVA